VTVVDVERPTSTLGTAVSPRYRELQGVKLGTVRSTFSPAVYQRSHIKALAYLVFDLALYALFIVGVFIAPNIGFKVVCGLLAGCAVAFLFVWAHDAAHGALFKSEVVSEILGTMAMLPSLNMYRLWTYGHNKVHHGFTSFSPVDWIWKPLTPAEFRSASRLRKVQYRVERSMAGCALHYLARVWWFGMVRFKAEASVRRRFHFTRARLTTLAFIAGASTLAWHYGGGIGGVLGAVVVPFVVFNYFIALFVYLHHTHPTLPFFDQRREWSATIGQVACSTVVRTSSLFESLTHGILIHTPHHVDMRIPFYRLKQARRDLRATYGEQLLEYRFRWSTVTKIFRTCQLFDFDRQVWYRFRDLPDLVDVPA
jgi:acyl-lipid omega-6 desaturase (Delta-12 desaturase)